jgi:secreted Zn-dependent insulinase-like peptidase
VWLLPHPVPIPSPSPLRPLPRAARLCAPAPNPDDENASVEVVFQLEHGALRNTVMADLLAHILKDPFFDQLRTKQQLGYLVFSGPRLDASVSSLRFILQVGGVGSGA